MKQPEGHAQHCFENESMDYKNSFGFLVSLMFYIGVVSAARSIEIVPRGGIPL